MTDDDMAKLLETERRIKELCGNDPDVHRRFLLILQEMILHHPQVDEIIRRLDRGDMPMVAEEPGSSWQKYVWLYGDTERGPDRFLVCVFGASPLFPDPA